MSMLMMALIHTAVLWDGAAGPLPLRKEGMLGVSGALTVALEGEEGPASPPQPTGFLPVSCEESLEHLLNRAPRE